MNDNAAAGGVDGLDKRTSSTNEDCTESDGKAGAIPAQPPLLLPPGADGWEEFFQGNSELLYWSVKFRKLRAIAYSFLWHEEAQHITGIMFNRPDVYHKHGEPEEHAIEHALLQSELWREEAKRG